MTFKPYFQKNDWIPASPPYGERFRIIKRYEVPDSQVYDCLDVERKEVVVLKAEAIGGYKRESRLAEESRFYDRLASTSGYDIVLNRFNGLYHRFLILKKLGIDLRRHVLDAVYLETWSEDQLKNYAIQMIGQLEVLHATGILHLDPKPNNFVTDADDTTRIRLIDFDVSKEFITSSKHIPYRTGLSWREIKGNRFYLSIHGHNLVEQSRRDDMIFLGYSMIWMARYGAGITPALPWTRDLYTEKESDGSNPEAKTNKNINYYNWMREKKMNCPLNELCDGFPYLADYMIACHELQFADKPDYQYLKSLFTI